MNSDDTDRLIYLSLLGIVIAMSYVLSNRTNIGKTMQYAGIWVLIFMGAIAVVGLWGSIKDTLIPPNQAFTRGETIVLPRANDGHYYLTLDVNNVPVGFVVDTGASQIVLSQQDAMRIGIDPSDLAYLGSANTANGEVRTAAVRLDTVTLDGLTDRDVRAVVNDGEMDGSLLGMTYLGRFESITIKNNELVLSR